jgi:predicted alpha/beta hydrolase family esterase
MPHTYVYLAGLGNSGPTHWQRLWHAQQGGLWVDHASWDAPIASLWMEDLDAMVAAQTKPVVLIAHSLGALLAAQWLAQGGQAKAAYMVALPDAAGASFPAEAGGFVPATILKVDVPVRMVASRNDPYASLDYAFGVSNRWGAAFWDMGSKGHINADSGLSSWSEGWQDLQKFLKGLPE